MAGRNAAGRTRDQPEVAHPVPQGMGWAISSHGHYRLYVITQHSHACSAETRYPPPCANPGKLEDTSPFDRLRGLPVPRLGGSTTSKILTIGMRRTPFNASTFMALMSKHDGYVEALQRSEEKYRRLVDRSYVLVFILDRALTIQFVCDSLYDILSREPGEVTGKPFFEAFGVPEGEVLVSLLEELAGQPLYTTRRTEIRMASAGTDPEGTRYFDLYATNMLEDVAVKGFVLYLHNVTGRKQAEEVLQRTNFELDSFVYKTSHDMRAPLLNLLGLIDIAQRDFPDETLRYLDYMKRSVLRLDKFILDLANYSRNDRTEVERTALDLTGLINTVLEDLRFLPNASRIRFEVDVQASQPVYADGVRLTIILKNLVSNAIKYHDLHKEQPFVRVKAWEQPGRHALTIEVSDNGAGIMETYRDRIFDMFFRATDKSEGSGLGLYIVKKAVEKLRGKIELKTRHREGTTFTITLPNAGA